jgi:hypothetical protein
MRKISETYGEILPEGVDKFLSVVKPSSQDGFLDLGSGKGKLLLQVFSNSPVNTAHGIEILPQLHEQAIHAEALLRQNQPALFTQRQLTFTLGDILAEPYPAATIALISSPCFSPTILNRLSDIIDSTPSIHTVLSLRPMLKLQRLSFRRTIRLECSWDTALCYVYS